MAELKHQYGISYDIQHYFDYFACCVHLPLTCRMGRVIVVGAPEMITDRYEKLSKLDR